MNGTNGTDPTVLVVEDERELRSAMVTWLEDCAVKIAADGQAALALYDETVDVVLLDRRLPDRSGDEILSQIRSRPGECQVAMVTAVDPGLDIADMAFDEYVVKPVDRAAVRAIVSRLDRRATYDELVTEQFAILETLATLEQHHDAQTLATSEEYARLQADLDRIETALDEAAAEFTHRDFAALLAREDTPPVLSHPAD